MAEVKRNYNHGSNFRRDVSAELEFETRKIVRTDEFSMTEIKLKGINKTVRNLECKAIYYIVSGSGRFTFLDTGEEKIVGPGDSVIIPRGEAFRDDGEMIMISLYQPPFNKGQVEYLD